MLSTNLGKLELKDLVAMRKIETKSKLQIEDNKIKPTVDFLKKLSDYLAEKFSSAVSVTQAFQLWQATAAYQSIITARYEHFADISFWYGLPNETINDEKFAGLYFNQGRVKAQQRLELGNYDYMDFEQSHDLTLLAYGDEELATQARNSAIKAKMDFEAQRNRK